MSNTYCNPLEIENLVVTDPTAPTDEPDLRDLLDDLVVKTSSQLAAAELLAAALDGKGKTVSGAAWALVDGLDSLCDLASKASVRVDWRAAK